MRPLPPSVNPITDIFFCLFAVQSLGVVFSFSLFCLFVCKCLLENTHLQTHTHFSWMCDGRAFIAVLAAVLRFSFPFLFHFSSHFSLLFAPVSIFSQIIDDVWSEKWERLLVAYLFVLFGLKGTILDFWRNRREDEVSVPAGLLCQPTRKAVTL